MCLNVCLSASSTFIQTLGSPVTDRVTPRVKHRRETKMIFYMKERREEDGLKVASWDRTLIKH